MIIKFGQNGEQGKEPKNNIDELSGTDSGHGTEEQPYLTEDELFAETPDFWKADAGEGIDHEQTADSQTDERERETETAAPASELSEIGQVQEQPEDNPGAVGKNQTEAQAAKQADGTESEARESEKQESPEGEETKAREADFQEIEKAVLRETERTVLREENIQEENDAPDKKGAGSEKSGSGSANEGRPASPEGGKEGTDGKTAGAQANAVPRRRRKAVVVQTKSPREEKKERLARSLQEYKKKLMTHRAKKWIRYGAVVLAVLVTLLIVTNVVRNWKYTDYSVLLTDTEEDTISSGYCNVNGNILKIGAGSASLSDRNNQTLWSVNYTIQSPAVAVCGSTVAIYDRNGTGICICDESGQIGSVSAGAPIVKVSVASQGVVAAILEDNDTTWIQYYDRNGESISMIRTTMDSPGYPLDLALSGDGTLMAVSYLCFENGQPKTRLYFYNFGSVGQNMMDNQVSSFEYSNTLTPQVEYLDGNICVAFRENGFTVFGGAQIPEERADVTVNQEIASTFYDGSHIGLVLQNENEDTAFQIVVYDTNGRELLRQDTDFDYRSIEIEDGQVVMYNQAALCVYSLDGVEKYNGSLDLAAWQLFSIGQNRYVVITEDSLNVMKLG